MWYYVCMKDVFSAKWIVIFVLLIWAAAGSKLALWLLILMLIWMVLSSLNSTNLFLNKKSMPEVINVGRGVGQIFGQGRKVFLLAAVLILAVILLFKSVVIIDAGYTGVYSLFGKVRDQELSSGFHLVNPLARVIPMSIRTEEYTMSIATGEGKRHGADSIAALTKEGLSVDLDITVLYHLEQDRASDVYKKVGLNYEEKIIRPSIRSVIREVIAQYEAKDIYSEKRQEAANKIFVELADQMKPRGIVLEDVLLRNVRLPENLAQAIQEKLKAEQEAQKYDFLLEKERKEAERKRIEAEGQRDAQAIINQSLTTNYLYYLYINQLKDRQGTIYVPTNPSTGMPLFRELGK